MSTEDLGLFSNNGSVKVSVHFSSAKDKHRSIADQSMRWHELDRLIDPSKNTLTIVIAETDLP